MTSSSTLSRAWSLAWRLSWQAWSSRSRRSRNPEELADDSDEIPLARVIPGTPDRGDPARPATPTRIVVYRRPLLARADNDDDLSDLVYDVVVEELARALGIDPDTIDPHYGEEPD